MEGAAFMKRIATVMAALLVAGLLAACNQEEEPKEADETHVTSVETAEAAEDDVTVEKLIYGRTAPAATTPVMLQAPGEIDSLEVENGDMVEEDDLLATVLTQAGKQNIYASEDGEISNLEETEGSMVSNEEPLAVIVDMETLHLQLAVTAEIRSLFEKEETYPAMFADNEYDATITSIEKMPNDAG